MASTVCLADLSVGIDERRRYTEHLLLGLAVIDDKAAIKPAGTTGDIGDYLG